MLAVRLTVRVKLQSKEGSGSRQAGPGNLRKTQPRPCSDEQAAPNTCRPIVNGLVSLVFTLRRMNCTLPQRGRHMHEATTEDARKGSGGAPG